MERVKRDVVSYSGLYPLAAERRNPTVEKCNAGNYRLRLLANFSSRFTDFNTSNLQRRNFSAR